VSRRRCALVDFSPAEAEASDEFFQLVLEAANQILNRRELGWEYEERRPPWSIVVSRDVAADDDFDELLKVVRETPGVRLATETKCQSTYG
jgi:hypothetical protein